MLGCFRSTELVTDTDATGPRQPSRNSTVKSIAEEELVLSDSNQAATAGRLPRSFPRNGSAVVVAEMQRHCWCRRGPRDFENEDHDPGIRRCDLNRGIGTIRHGNKIARREVKGAKMQFWPG